MELMEGAVWLALDADWIAWERDRSRERARSREREI